MKVVRMGTTFDSNAEEVYGSLDGSYCLKRKVCALIVDDEDQVLGLGWNGPRDDVFPRSGKCPRMDSKTGEDYDLCTEFCPGSTHAEVHALQEMEDSQRWYEPRGEKSMYVCGHEYICVDCMKRIEEAGIDNLYLVTP